MNPENADLEARFAVPAEHDLPPGRHELHREILMNHMRTQPPPGKTTRHGGSRRWLPPARALAAAAAVTAVAAGAGGYAITAAQAPAARPPAANRPASSRARPGQAAQQAVLAAKVLRAAAAHVRRAGVTSEPGPAQWIYYKTVSYGYPGIVGPSGITTDEEWITFDGVQSAYHDGPQSAPIVTHTSPIPRPGPAVNPWTAYSISPSPMTAYNALAALPAAPQALLKVIARQAASQNAENLVGAVAGGVPATQAQREFDYLTQLLWNAAVTGGPPAAEAAAYQALADLPGITVQQGIKDTAGGQATGVSDDGGYDQLLIDPASYQVIGIRKISTGTRPMGIAQALASGHITPSLRKLLAGLTKAERDRLVAEAKRLKGERRAAPPAFPPAGTLISESVHTQAAEVLAPGDR